MPSCPAAAAAARRVGFFVGRKGVLEIPMVCMCVGRMRLGFDRGLGTGLGIRRG